MAEHEQTVAVRGGTGVGARKSSFRSYLGTDSRFTLVAVPLGIVILGVGLSAWTATVQYAKETRDVEQGTQLITPVAASRFEMLLDAELGPLRRVQRGVSGRSIQTAQQFIAAASSAQRLHESLEKIVWVDDSGVVQAFVPPDGSELEPGRSVLEYKGWAEAFGRSRSPARNAVAAGQRAERPLQWFCLPYVGPPRNGVRPRGAVMAQTNLDTLVRAMFDEGTWALFNIIVRDEDGRLVCTSGQGDASARHGAEQTVIVFHSPWTVELRPTDAFISTRRGRTPQFALFGGIGVTTLAALGAAQAMLHRRRSRRQLAAHLAALEALNTLSAAMSERPDESAQVLQELAEVAARLMGMSVCVVTLYDASENVMRVVYRRGFEPVPPRDVYAPHETPISLDCMAHRRAIMFGDIEQNSPFDIEKMRHYRIRSMILLPLIVGDESMGVILLACGSPRRFTELDEQLTKLWTVQATAILSSSRLYERMNAALTSARRLLEQRETLYRVNTSIQHAGSHRDALDRIAELAPQALGVDICVVCLQARDPDCVQIAAVTPGEERPAAAVNTVLPCPVCASVMRARQVQVVPDTSATPLRGYPDMHSALFVPLSGTGPDAGMLVLLRRHAGQFDPEQIRMAEIFAARASSAIESARLHEQTVRQAETNAILLRELNHRVGNNLASIVGLLSMGASELPGEARQWLDRAIERVSMMARAHELFAGGVQSVPLGELIRTTLGSVSAIKGSDVRVRVKLETDELRLPAGRAVTLAMVLHELAYNSVVHALSGGGELIVRVRRIGAAEGESRIAIDVIDRAAVAADLGDNGRRHTLGLDDSGSVRGTGIGLQLVRNLVSRELRGSFRLEQTPDGGTCASVELPLNSE